MIKFNYSIITRPFFVLLISYLSHQQNAFSQCQTLVWSDEFNDATLSTANWNYVNGGGGYGNNELENYTSRSENIKLEDGKLKITALKENYGGNAYTSAKITSQDKYSVTYGRVEARIKIPGTQGLWPAFWMMPQSSVYGSWPASGEIDIMEVKGSNVYENFGTIHYGSSTADHKYSGETISVMDDLSADFHTYAVEWKKDTIQWYLDDVNFYTVTKTGIAPAAWPFDQNFYIIFNVAVGGWFGGDPNGATIFPQTMEVDYVRVYSNPQSLSITGKANVLSGDISSYTIKNGSASSYTWNVPADATIIYGQNTDSVTVKWGSTNDLSVDIVKGLCGAFKIDKKVTVTPNGCNVVFDDFESNKIITYKTATGTFNPRAANPGTNAINSSTQVASYIRNSGTQYDLLYYSADVVSNSTEYENGKKILFMDVYTTAPVGTIINWQFENKARVAGAYPSGRRAVFVGKTTVQNQWERIKFLYNSTPDAATPPASIDQFTFLVKPDSYTNHTYYFDNLMRRDAENCGLAGIKDASEHHVTISPNPAHDNITLSLTSVSPEPLDIIITDILGVQVIQHSMLNNSSDVQESIDVSALQPGVYILYTKQQNSISSIKIIKQ